MLRPLLYLRCTTRMEGGRNGSFKARVPGTYCLEFDTTEYNVEQSAHGFGKKRDVTDQRVALPFTFSNTKRRSFPLRRLGQKWGVKGAEE